MSESIDSLDSLHEAPILTPDAADASNSAASDVAASDPEASDEVDERLAVALPHVALIGQAKSGKTAIAHALFGSDTEPTLVDIADRYQGEGAPLVLDDLPGWAHGNESSLDSLFSYLKTARKSGSVPDLIWYTLDASGARVTEYEVDLIRRFAGERPVAIVLTRCDLVAPDVLANMRSTLAAAEIAGSLGIISVAADPLPVLGVAPYGLDALIAIAEAAISLPADEPATVYAETFSDAEVITLATPDATPVTPEEEPAEAAASPAPVASEYSASAVQPTPAPEEWRDPIRPLTPPTEADSAARFSASAPAVSHRGGASAGQALVPAEAGPSTTSLIALAAVIALAIALLLLQLRRRDEEEE